MKSETGHVHQWKPTAHVDGCHFYEWRFGCECGETRVDRRERDFRRFQPMAMLGYEREKPCERCLELAVAARADATLKRRLEKLRAASVREEQCADAPRR